MNEYLSLRSAHNTEWMFLSLQTAHPLQECLQILDNPNSPAVSFSSPVSDGTAVAFLSCSSDIGVEFQHRNSFMVTNNKFFIFNICGLCFGITESLNPKSNSLVEMCHLDNVCELSEPQFHPLERTIFTSQRCHED